MIRLTIGTTKISVISATRIVNIGSLGGGVREQVIFDLFQVQRGDPISILDFLSRQVSYRKYERFTNKKRSNKNGIVTER